MGELAKDLKFWPGVAAIGLELLGLGLLGLAVLESRGPTCVVSMCDDAHVPSPGLMLAIFALGLAAMLTVVSLWMAAVAGLAWRTTRGFSEALTVGLGLAALAGQWAGAAALGNRQGLTFPIEFAAGMLLIGSYFAVFSGLAPLAIGWGSYRTLRTRSLERRPTAAVLGGFAAIGTFAAWMAVGAM